MEARFSKNQLLKSKKYKAYRDVLCAILDGSKSYSAAEVEGLLKDFLARKV